MFPSIICFHITQNILISNFCFGSLLFSSEFYTLTLQVCFTRSFCRWLLIIFFETTSLSFVQRPFRNEVLFEIACTCFRPLCDHGELSLEWGSWLYSLLLTFLCISICLVFMHYLCDHLWLTWGAHVNLLWCVLVSFLFTFSLLKMTETKRKKEACLCVLCWCFLCPLYSPYSPLLWGKILRTNELGKA